MGDETNQARNHLSPEVRAAALAAMAAWVAAIADRFTNPIAGMVAALEMVDKRALTDPVALDSIARVQARLLALGDFVSELVDFAKPARLTPAPVDVRALLARVAAELRPSLPAATRLEVVVEPGAERLRADPDKLRLILRALLDNAVQAVPPPGVPAVAMTARPGVAPGAVTFTVDDSGPGFPPELAQAVLEPFVSTKEAGSGLGLAIVHKYVDAHGGRIELGRSSRLGGACVSVTLPTHN
jgi:signal transduction histidine kinase